MTRNEEIEKASVHHLYQYDYSYEEGEHLDFYIKGFTEGAKWADKNPNSRTIAEYLYKEKGYPISLNGDIPTYEEVVKHVQAYNNYKMRQKACDGLGTADAEPNLASLWHNASEEPIFHSDIVVIDKHNGWWDIQSYDDEDYDYKELYGWEACVENYEIVRWAYISDLLPKGGEK